MAVSKLLFMASFPAVFFSLLVGASASASDIDNNGGSGGGGYGFQKPKLAEEEERLLSTMIGIQGVIYYKSASKTAPLEGAVARITCEAVDEYGYEAASYSFLSDLTDARGYFLATLFPSEVDGNRQLRECRAFLELSSSENCRSPTDLNNGTTGALLRSYRFLVNKKMKLFSVGPFLFTCEA